MPAVDGHAATKMTDDMYESVVPPEEVADSEPGDLTPDQCRVLKARMHLNDAADVFDRHDNHGDFTVEAFREAQEALSRARALLERADNPAADTVDEAITDVEEFLFYERTDAGSQTRFFASYAAYNSIYSAIKSEPTHDL